jgi:hypothetical protein
MGLAKLANPFISLEPARGRTPGLLITIKTSALPNLLNLLEAIEFAAF